MLMSGKLELLGQLLTFMILFENCIATEITSNIDGLICPGEEVIYTCVSQGTSQRWRLDNAKSGVLIEYIYIRGQQPGHTSLRYPYTFALVSAEQNQFKSTVSVIATKSINNTVVECTDTLSRDSTTIGIAGAPSSPTNIRSAVGVHHEYFSTILFTWDAPDDNSRVDYYQYRVENGTNNLVYNTSNTTAVLSEIVYNDNVTFSVVSLNCIGESDPLSQVIHIVGCREFDYFSFNINRSAFSQAPGTQIILSCDNIYSASRDIIITCESDGRWEPDPESMPCAIIDPTIMEKNYSRTLVNIYDVSKILDVEASPPKQIITVTLVLIPFYVLAMIGFCLLAVFATVYIVLKLRKQQICAGANEVIDNQMYYDTIDPIYERIPTPESESSTQDNFGITAMSNDAYNNIHSQETKCCHSPALLDFNISNNEAYVPGEKLISMQDNSSYQAATLLQCRAVAVSEGSTKKHQHYEKQTIENIQQKDSELSCNSVECVSPKK